MPLLRTLKQRFGIAAPRVAVRTHLPWYWRWLAIGAVGGIAAGAGWRAYESGAVFSGDRPARADAAMASEHEPALAVLRARAAHAERQLEIERATRGDLAKQLKALAEENATLREDLAFFQTLMPAGGRSGTVTINRFRVQSEPLPGEYRYRLLLVQTGPRERDFEGHLQFVVNFVKDDEPAVLTLPAEGEREAKEYQVRFRFFQRIEGIFKVAPDAVVRSMQVRVFENGSKTPKLAQTVNAL